MLHNAYCDLKEKDIDVTGDISEGFMHTYSQLESFIGEPM
jgi:hypothetical protein